MVTRRTYERITENGGGQHKRNKRKAFATRTLPYLSSTIAFNLSNASSYLEDFAEDFARFSDVRNSYTFAAALGKRRTCLGRRELTLARGTWNSSAFPALFRRGLRVPDETD